MAQVQLEPVKIIRHRYSLTGKNIWLNEGWMPGLELVALKNVPLETKALLRATPGYQDGRHDEGLCTPVTVFAKNGSSHLVDLYRYRCRECHWSNLGRSTGANLIQLIQKVILSLFKARSSPFVRLPSRHRRTRSRWGFKSSGRTRTRRSSSFHSLPAEDHPLAHPTIAAFANPRRVSAISRGQLFFSILAGEISGEK